MNRPVVIEGAVPHTSINCKKGVEIHHVLAAVVELVRIRITRVELVLLWHHHVGQHIRVLIGHVLVHHGLVRIGGKPGEGLDTEVYIPQVVQVFFPRSGFARMTTQSTKLTFSSPDPPNNCFLLHF